MSRRDLLQNKVRLNVDLLKTALLWLLRGADWGRIQWREDCTWKTPRLLAVTALLWSWSDEDLVADRLHISRKIALRMFPQTQSVATSFQAFIKLLRRWSPEFVTALQRTLRARMAAELSDFLTVAGFHLFAVDGSRVEVPRTLSHQSQLSSRRLPTGKNRRSSKGKRQRGKVKRSGAASDAHRKKAESPSLWLTLLWHVGTGLPWDWRLGPCDSSERGHWQEMLGSVKQRAMFVADAGFAGYEYAKAVVQAGHELTIRVGANVKLLKKLGVVREQEGLVCLWPERAARKKQLPLCFRLLRINNGKYPIYLLTSVLSQEELSDEEVVEIYKRRWGIELFYRHLKQTFGRRKLKSASAENAYVEMHWSLLGLWSMALYALKELLRTGTSPQRLSFAKLIRAFRRTMKESMQRVTPGEGLCDLLQAAAIDAYQRGEKRSRGYPRKKQERPAGMPQVVIATLHQQDLAKKLVNAA
jgi:hypothetical protein